MPRKPAESNVIPFEPTWGEKLSVVVDRACRGPLAVNGRTAGRDDLAVALSQFHITNAPTIGQLLKRESPPDARYQAFATTGEKQQGEWSHGLLAYLLLVLIGQEPEAWGVNAGFLPPAITPDLVRHAFTYRKYAALADEFYKWREERGWRERSPSKFFYERHLKTHGKLATRGGRRNGWTSRPPRGLTTPSDVTPRVSSGGTTRKKVSA